MDSSDRNLQTSKNLDGKRSPLAEVPLRAADYGAQPRDVGTTPTQGPKTATGANVRHEPDASVPRAKRRLETKHATRWDERPTYYDKPYVSVRPRPISLELEIFYREIWIDRMR